MGKIKHIITLTSEEKEILLKVIEDPTSPERHITRAKILLASDLDNPGRMTVEKIAREYNTTRPTVMLTRQNYMKLGLDGAVKGKKRETPPVPSKMTKVVEAQIIHLLWSPPPPGRRRWTMRLLAQKAQEEGILDYISRTSVNQILKKYGLGTQD